MSEQTDGPILLRVGRVFWSQTFPNRPDPSILEDGTGYDLEQMARKALQGLSDEELLRLALTDEQLEDAASGLRHANGTLGTGRLERIETLADLFETALDKQIWEGSDDG